MLRKGESTFFQCQITGTPEIKVTWYLDGNDISDKHRISFVDGIATLEITDSDIGDSGIYVCEASNEAGSESCSIDVKVKGSFFCKHAIILQTSIVALELFCKLSPFSPHCRSPYHCIELSKGNNIFFLSNYFIYLEPPSFLQKIENVTTVLGSSAVFQCAVAGSPPLSVSWIKGDKIVEQDDNTLITFENNIATLYIRSVETHHPGRYICQATNESGSEKSIPPSFTKKLTKMDKVLGSSIQMECKVSGSLPISSLWYKDGNEIIHSAKHRPLCHENTISLTIVNLDPSDNGNYKCKVTNVAGSAECSGVLTVKEPPKFIKKLETTKVVKIGDSIRCECKISGSPEIKITWYKNDTEIKSSDKYSMSFIDFIPVLEINNLGTEDSGDYTCEASNDAGSASCSIKIVAKEPPVFCRKPSPAEILKGVDVSLECELLGTAPFEITWFKDRRQIRSSKKYKITSKQHIACVHILNVETADIGDYHCKATNDVGTDSCICTLKLKEPPRFVKKVDSVSIISGESLELQAVIEGSQPISVLWLKEKEDVIRESENIKISHFENIATLQIRKAELTNAGKYICQIKNDAGMRECIANVTVLGKNMKTQ
uniref:Ig-like domain-containing protein n=1 Tax=Xenopus tropicalis TaxID=8364 RepID=A0A803JL31_XENTR